MKIDRGKITPVKHTLVGFSGEQVVPYGSIELLVMEGTFSRQRTIMVKFLVIDRPSAYNVILRRMGLNELKVVTSTPHLSMKFPIEERVGVEKGNQKAARECYNTSLKKLPRAFSLEEKMKEDGK
jgi:hypothetical protein